MVLLIAMNREVAGVADDRSPDTGEAVKRMIGVSLPAAMSTLVERMPRP